MSTEFLSAEELAELEAELSDLDDSDEPDATEGASEEALDETPKETSKAAEPPETETVEAVAEVDEEAELEAEIEAELETAAFEADAIESELNVAEPKTDPEPETDPAVYEADEGPTEAPEVSYSKPETDLEPELVEEDVVEDATPEPVANTTSATNSEDELTDMLLNAGTVFNPRQLQKDLTFHENNLDDAFMSQAGMFAHYSGVAHRAARRYDQIAQQVKLVEAKLDQEVRSEASHSGEKLTEAAIKNRILLDARHRKITDRMLDAKAVAGMTRDACESFKQRRDMLIQIGANVREEHKGEMRMKAARSSQDDMKERALAHLNQG